MYFFRFFGACINSFRLLIKSEKELRVTSDVLFSFTNIKTWYNYVIKFVKNTVKWFNYIFDFFSNFSSIENSFLLVIEFEESTHIG